jgi:eukaryotic-like serine/threonine-protein kinase
MHREMSEQADQLERFRQEARAVAKLSHPTVVAVIDGGTPTSSSSMSKGRR